MGINPYESPMSAEPAGRQFRAPPVARAFTYGMAGAQFGLGFATGFVLWAIHAPREAWDVYSSFSLTLFIAGIVIAMLWPRSFYAGLIGLYLGQIVGLTLLVPTQGAIVPAVLAVLLFGMPQAIVGALLGVLLGIVVYWVVGRFTRA